MSAEYIKAVQMKDEWLHWAHTHGYKSHVASGGIPDNVFQMYQYTLGMGDTYYMSPKFCSLVDHARLTVPDNLAFDPSWMQSKVGFMWLENPFELPSELVTEDNKRLDVPKVELAAIGWVETMIPGEYEILCFIDYGKFMMRGDTIKGFGCWSYFGLSPGDTLLDKLQTYEAKAVEGRYADDTVRLKEKVNVFHEIRWVYTALYLMNQRLAIKVRHTPDRATRRRAEARQEKIPDFIRVITLRRLEEDRAIHGHKNVAWNWCWEVRGHWRNQYMASTGDHKPVFVEAYVKGPLEKPLKPPVVRIFKAAR